MKKFKIDCSDTIISILLIVGLSLMFSFYKFEFKKEILIMIGSASFIIASIVLMIPTKNKKSEDIKSVVMFLTKLFLLAGYLSIINLFLIEHTQAHISLLENQFVLHILNFIGYLPIAIFLATFYLFLKLLKVLEKY